jgi:hypothetical protein
VSAEQTAFDRHYQNWRGLQPKGISDRDALQRYYETMDNARERMNQQATIAGHRANWAWRRLQAIPKDQAGDGR